MGKRDGIPLDTVDPKRCSVQQQINDMVIQQVDLIDVEEAAISCC